MAITTSSRRDVGGERVRLQKRPSACHCEHACEAISDSRGRLAGRLRFSHTPPLLVPTGSELRSPKQKELINRPEPGLALSRSALVRFW